MKIIILENDRITKSLIKNVMRNNEIELCFFSELHKALDEAFSSQKPFIWVSDIITTAEIELHLLKKALKFAPLKGMLLLSGYNEEIIDAARNMVKSQDLKNISGVALPASLKTIRQKLYQIIENASEYNLSYEIEDDLCKDDINLALEQDLIVPYYQAKICSVSKEIIGFEILSRLNINGRIYAPAHFIDKIIMLNKISEFTYQVLNKSLNETSTIRNFSGSLSLNVDYQSLNELNFCQNLLAILEEHNFPPKRLTLEITEDRPQINLEVLRSLTMLRMHGCEISIDDFGMKNSGFSELLRLPFTEIKIDRSFISDMHESERSLKIVKALCSVAQSLGYTIVAEGVETLKQQKTLMKLKVDLLQGFLYSKPIPLTEAKILIKNGLPHVKAQNETLQP